MTTQAKGIYCEECGDRIVYGETRVLRGNRALCLKCAVQGTGYAGKYLQAPESEQVAATAEPAWVEAAKIAYHTAIAAQEAQRQEEDARRTAEMNEATVRKVRETLGLEAQSVEDGVATVDGYRFKLGRYQAVKILLPCTICGQDTHIDVYDQTSLGSALSSETRMCYNDELHAEIERNLRGPVIVPEREGVEDAYTPPPAPLERLGQALIDYLLEQGYLQANYE